MVKRILISKPSWLDEFKAFIARGNVVDLAVGIIIGAAFTTIVNSLVADIIMPLRSGCSWAGSISRTFSWCA